MLVPMVHVRIMLVRVHHRFVNVTMAVRNGVRHRGIARPVRMLMMLVVHVCVVVLHALVHMLVDVPLRHV